MKLAEFKKQIGVGVVASVAAAIIVGLLAVNVFPMSSVTTTTTSGGFGTPGINVPSGPGFYVENISCSLRTGVCAFTIVNNMTVSLASVGCQFSLSEGIVKGAMGGAAVNGMPANSTVGASCSVPTSELTNETAGSYATGGITVKFLQNWPTTNPQFGPGGWAGDEPTFSFQGTWSSSSNQTTTTVTASTGTNPYPTNP